MYFAAVLSEESIAAIGNRYMQESVSAAFEWIRIASARREGLVGFFH